MASVQVEPQHYMSTGVVPFGPLPVGEGAAGSLLQLPTSLHVDQPVSDVSAITPAQRLRDAQSMIFRKVIEDSVSLIQLCVDMCSDFATACGVTTVVGESGVFGMPCPSSHCCMNSMSFDGTVTSHRSRC